MKKIALLLYIFFLVIFAVFSYGFVDFHFPYKILPFLADFVSSNRVLTTIAYISFVVFFFVFYGLILVGVKNGKLNTKEILYLIGITVVMLFFSFPGFSYDIFNYIATAKIVFLYKENPYIVMPIEIRNEPMLTFLHAANKTALYGPIWILLTGIPYYLGLKNLLLNVFTFKFLMLIFYLGLVRLIWLLSNKNLWSLAFFALNPLVTIETLISSHNDVVMIFFAMFSFFLLKRKKIFLSSMFFLFSIFIKFATIFLFPIYLYLVYTILSNGEIIWKNIWKWSALSMLVVFFLSPLREELYSWYFIWPLSFVALFGESTFLEFVSLGFSLGLPLRFAPFILTNSWSGMTPLVKKMVSLIFPILFSALYMVRKKS